MKMTVFWNVARCNRYILTDVSEELTACIMRVMRSSPFNANGLLHDEIYNQQELSSFIHHIFGFVLWALAGK
jgi:hypothetical protein